MKHRILLVGTSPYSTSATSRTYDASLHFWNRESVAHIFSRNWVPQKGHCFELYQITDADLLKHWLNPKREPGRIYKYEDLEEQSGIQEIKSSKAICKLYSFGIKHSPTIEILRRIVWSRKIWCTKQLNEWLDKFQPECVVYSFSNHVFFQQIALYVANRYNIPIIISLGDDFYFQKRFSISPAYWLYRYLFRKYTKEILFRKGSCATYCSRKIKKKYDDYFHLRGDIIYHNSEIKRRKFKAINTITPSIVYFGSIRLGRNNSLIDIADALKGINPNYMLEVYSGENDKSFYQKMQKHSNIIYGGSIPYSEVQKKISKCDIFVIVEGFRHEDILMTQYSLSTKTPDGLASGASILVYGPEEAGVVDYMKRNNAAMVCTNKNELKTSIKELIENQNKQKELYDAAIEITAKNHLVESSTKVFETVVNETIERYKNII